MAAIAKFALPAQFLPDFGWELSWRLYRKKARRPGGKGPASKLRIVIEGSEFEALLERLECALEHLRRYLVALFGGLVFCHIICLKIKELYIQYNH